MAILFDFDEVFVDINTNALKYINEKLKTNYQLSDVTTWDFYDIPEVRPLFLEYLLIPDLYQRLAIPNQAMIRIAKQLVEMGEKVYIVTASVEGSHESKARFIAENMKFIDEKNIFVVNQTSKYKVKSDVLSEMNLNYHEPTVLVDDGVHNILDMMADVKHKDKLDSMMSNLYSNKSLKKFNNPFHEFIYGIIPELPYNKNISDGKRIFKIKDTLEIWNVLKNIKKNHIGRISKKQNEIFFYFNELIDHYLMKEDKYDPKKNKIIQNTKYLIDYYLSQNEHKSFLNKLLECTMKIKELSNENIENVLEKTEKIFGNEVMYKEIKGLINLHAEIKQEPLTYSQSMKSAQFYKITSEHPDLFFISLLSDLMIISQENLNLLERKDLNKDLVDKLLKDKNLSSQEEVEYKANFLKALNEDLLISDCTIARKTNISTLIQKTNHKNKMN